jgi:chemotaxis signal transduction protein
LEKTLFEPVKREEGRHLGFMLGASHYAIPAASVQGIHWGALEIQPLPGAPPSVKGLVHLHGRTVPVLDPRVHLGLPEFHTSRERCVIALDLLGGQGSGPFGLLADSVTRMLNQTELGPQASDPKAAPLDLPWLLDACGWSEFRGHSDADHAA